MRTIYLIIGMSVLLMLASCKGTSKVSSSTPSKKVEEDLSKYMYKPKSLDNSKKTETPAVVNTQGITFEKHINGTINPLMDSIAVSNKRYHSAPGYRIMVYSGNSSEESAAVRKEVYEWSRDYEVYTQYKQPAFRVKVGNFEDRINANYVYSDLVKFFPNAVIIPDQIEIK
ncbi:MAG: hypothetical protein K0R51_783 [Cytophagaceae bacterium]|jgi:hypothetical protein|nr:hypothetical protein [Cytophagaceae bacterium]